MFTPAFYSSWHLSIWLFRCICYYTPCIFACTGFSAISYQWILLMSPFCSWGLFGWSISPKIWRGFHSWWHILLLFPIQTVLFFPYNILRGLCSCIWLFDHLIACVLALPWALACPSVPLLIGDPELLARTVSQRPGKSAPFLLFYCLVTEKVLIVCLPFIWGNFYVAIFPRVLCVGDI